jgi:magnesium transporter
MEENVIYALTTDDKEEVARTISDYGFLALPIVDHETRIVGIVTVDDAIDVLEEENTEDIAKMAATTPSDKPYLKTSVFSIWKNRIPWLLVLMVSATFTGLILNTYEGRLNAISSALFACVPMLMDTGGNSGAQASVTIIRSLALGEVRSRDLLKVLWKELRPSVLLGLTLGLACFAKLMLIDNLLFGFDGYTPLRCLVVSLSLFITVVIAKIVGCSLPILAKKCKLDPAVVASPFITTIMDALALILYCSLAVWILA